MSNGEEGVEGNGGVKKHFAGKVLKYIASSDEMSILAIFAVIIIAVCIAVPKFRTLYNILVVMRQFSLLTIVAMGQTLVLISGAFDLSVGSIVALSGMAGTYLAVTLGLPVLLSVFIAILVGAGCGGFNGFLVSKVKINPIIATLASGWIFSGLILVTTKGWPISGFPKDFAFVGQGYFLGVPLPVIMMVVIAAILMFFLSKTIYGRFLYAIGGNQKSSFFAGLNVSKYRIMAYIICGALAGFAGVVLSSRMGSAQAKAGLDWTLPSVAAAVIGGVSLWGGKGRIYGVVVGSALLGIINNVLVLLHVSAYWQSLISGFILILAVAFDSYRRGREEI
jgi:ribose transport system permease protein